MAYLDTDEGSEEQEPELPVGDSLETIKEREYIPKAMAYRKEEKGEPLAELPEEDLRIETCVFTATIENCMKILKEPEIESSEFDLSPETNFVLPLQLDAMYFTLTEPVHE